MRGLTVTTTTTTTSETTTDRLTAREVKIVIAGCVTAMALSSLDGTAVNTALLQIVTELGGLRAYTWVGTAYLLTSTASMMLFGKMSDLFGRRLLFQIAIITFTVASLACALAQNMTELVLARGLQGVGGGGLQALTFTIIADLIAPRERAKVAGTVTSVFAGMAVIGPLFGGFVTQHFTWRLIFWVNLPLGAVSLFVVGRTLRLPFRPSERRVDYLGATLIVAAVFAAVLALTWMPSEYGWSSPTTIITGAAGLAFAVAFIWWETKASQPIVPLHLFRIRAVSESMALNATCGAVLIVVPAFLSLFLQAVTGYSPTKAGLLMVPNIVFMSVGANLSGRSISRTGHYRRWPIGGSLVLIASLGLLTGLRRDGPGFALLWPSLVLLGAAVGLTMTPTTVSMQNAVPLTEMGIATSLMQFLRSLSSTLGLAGFGAVLNAKLSAVDPRYLRAPRDVQLLPSAERDRVLDTMASAITYTFRFLVPLGIVAFLLAVISKELPLRRESMHGAATEPEIA